MAERQRAVLVLLGGLFVRQGERFGNLHHEHHDEGQREDAHGDEQGGCGVADRGLCGVPHEITYQHRNDRGGQRVERTAELHELVATVAAAVIVMALPVYADDPLATINALSDFVFSAIKAIGAILLGFGIVQIGLALKSHDAGQRAQGFMTFFGGVVIYFAKDILDMIL